MCQFRSEHTISWDILVKIFQIKFWINLESTVTFSVSSFQMPNGENQKYKNAEFERFEKLHTKNNRKNW